MALNIQSATLMEDVYNRLKQRIKKQSKIMIYIYDVGFNYAVELTIRMDGSAPMNNVPNDEPIAAMAAESVRQGGAERSEAQHLADLGAYSATGA